MIENEPPFQLPPSTKKQYNLLGIKVMDISQTLELIPHQLSVNQFKQMISVQHSIFCQLQRILERYVGQQYFDVFKKMMGNSGAICSFLANRLEKQMIREKDDSFPTSSQKQSQVEKVIEKVIEQFNASKDIVFNQLGGIHLFNESYNRHIDSQPSEIKLQDKEQFNASIEQQLYNQTDVQNLNPNDEVKIFLESRKNYQVQSSFLNYEQDLEDILDFFKLSEKQATIFLHEDPRKQKLGNQDFASQVEDIEKEVVFKRKVEKKKLDGKMKQVIDKLKIKLEQMQQYYNQQEMKLLQISKSLKRQTSQVQVQTTQNFQHQIQHLTKTIQEQNMRYVILQQMKQQGYVAEDQVEELKGEIKLKEITLGKYKSSIDTKNKQIDHLKMLIRENRDKLDYNLDLIEEQERKNRKKNAMTKKVINKSRKNLQSIQQMQEKDKRKVTIGDKNKVKKIVSKVSKTMKFYNVKKSNSTSPLEGQSQNENSNYQNQIPLSPEKQETVPQYQSNNLTNLLKKNLKQVVIKQAKSQRNSKRTERKDSLNTIKKQKSIQNDTIQKGVSFHEKDNKSQFRNEKNKNLDKNSKKLEEKHNELQQEKNKKEQVTLKQKKIPKLKQKIEKTSIPNSEVNSQINLSEQQKTERQYLFKSSKSISKSAIKTPKIKSQLLINLKQGQLEVNMQYNMIISEPKEYMVMISHKENILNSEIQSKKDTNKKSVQSSRSMKFISHSKSNNKSKSKSKSKTKIASHKTIIQPKQFERNARINFDKNQKYKKVDGFNNTSKIQKIKEIDSRDVSQNRNKKSSNFRESIKINKEQIEQNSPLTCHEKQPFNERKDQIFKHNNFQTLPSRQVQCLKHTGQYVSKVTEINETYSSKWRKESIQNMGYVEDNQRGILTALVEDFCGNEQQLEDFKAIMQVITQQKEDYEKLPTDKIKQNKNFKNTKALQAFLTKKQQKKLADKTQKSFSDLSEQKYHLAKILFNGLLKANLPLMNISSIFDRQKSKLKQVHKKIFSCSNAQGYCSHMIKYIGVIERLASIPEQTREAMKIPVQNIGVEHEQARQNVPKKQECKFLKAFKKTESGLEKNPSLVKLPSVYQKFSKHVR